MTSLNYTINEAQYQHILVLQLELEARREAKQRLAHKAQIDGLKLTIAQDCPGLRQNMAQLLDHLTAFYSRDQQAINRELSQLPELAKQLGRSGFRFRLRLMLAEFYARF